jgi:hypothetical protein
MHTERRTPANAVELPGGFARGYGSIRMLAPAARGPGRPREMSVHDLLERIRRLAASRDGLFRVHRRSAGLYARARRSFGSWSAAVAAAGLDYQAALHGARRRSIRSRRRSRRAATR